MGYRAKRKATTPAGAVSKASKKTAEVFFDFVGLSWTMESACRRYSTNPAPHTHPGIYIIHNENTNNTYVGYAENAHDRWKSRTEAFHCLGLRSNYAKKVHCAFCIPSFYFADGTSRSLANDQLKGSQKAEHLLIRGAVKGLMGATICTNTKTAFTPYKRRIGRIEVNRVSVFLPASFGRLRDDSSFALTAPY